MRLPVQENRRFPFRVQALAPDFEPLDLWELPIEADAAKGETFDRFAEVVIRRGLELATEGPLNRALFGIRFAAGRLFGWDKVEAPLPIPGCLETSIAARLTDADRAANRARPEESVRFHYPPTGDSVLIEFKAIYRFQDEMLMEISNKTIHALVHFGWVPKTNGKWTARVGIYIKSRGIMSDIYMGVIGPFRHLIIYPSWLSHMAHAWSGQTAGGPAPAAPGTHGQ